MMGNLLIPIKDFSIKLEYQSDERFHIYATRFDNYFFNDSVMPECENTVIWHHISFHAKLRHKKGDHLVAFSFLWLEHAPELTCESDSAVLQ